MYDLPNHKENDEAVLREFILAQPFAFVTGCDAEGSPVATQLPVFLEERDGGRYLIGHLMKGTDHHKAFASNQNVLVVFTGPHTYVSGSWYSNPHTPSTWNYMSVHARGAIRFLDGNALERILQQTSLHFEGGNEQSPTTFANLPSKLTGRLVHAIAAFEIEVTSMDSVFKLSQDRDVDSYFNIIRKLEEQGEDGRAIAAEMTKRAAAQFPDEKG